MCSVELRKLILKSLLKNLKNFSIVHRLYFQQFFTLFTRFSSISYTRRYCIITRKTRSVFFDLKMVRHTSKLYASTGFLVGMRKSSF